MARWFALVLLVGCAPPPAPVEPSTEAAAARGDPEASASAPVAAAPSGPGPTPLPVAVPKNLLVSIKSRPLAATADELGRVLGLPLGAVLRAMGSDVVRMDAGLGAVVLLDDGGEGELPRPLGAFSVPLVSEAAFTTAAASGWRKQSVGHVRTAEPLAGLFCKPVVALGDAPLRLVCGANEDQVAQAAPYLTRGLPGADLGQGDLRVELRFDPLKDRYLAAAREQQQQASMLAWGGGMLLGGVGDADVLAAPGVVLDEGVRFAGALDGANFGLALDGERREVVVDGRVRFKGTSWLVRLLTTKSPKGPPPEVFFRLPRDSEVALWGRGVDASLLEEPRRVLRRGVSLLLGKLDVDQGDRRAIDEAIAAIPPGDAAWALASGASTADAARASKGAAGSWWVMGSEAPATIYAAWLRKTGQALKRGIAAGRKAGLDALKDAGASVRVEESPGGFAPGSTLLELSGKVDPQALAAFGGDGGGGKPERVTLFAVAMPDGKERSWFGLSTSRVALRERMLQVRGGASEQLGSRAEVAAARGEKASFGGVVALGERLGEALRKAGKGGRGGPAPVLLLGDSEADKIEVRARVGAAAVADLGGLIGNVLRP